MSESPEAALAERPVDENAVLVLLEILPPKNSNVAGKLFARPSSDRMAEQL